MSRPTNYPPRRKPDPAPLPADMQTRIPDPAGALPVTPEGQGARPDDERQAAAGRLPSRSLVGFLVEARGLDCLTTDALRLLAELLAIIEAPTDATKD
jgi:hypothetical protein